MAVANCSGKSGLATRSASHPPIASHLPPRPRERLFEAPVLETLHVPAKKNTAYGTETTVAQSRTPPEYNQVCLTDKACTQSQPNVPTI